VGIFSRSFSLRLLVITRSLWCSPLVELQRQFLPVFDVLSESLSARALTHQIPTAHHNVAVSWVANIILIVCFAIFRAGMLFDTSVNPDRRHGIDLSSRWTAFVFLGFWIVGAVIWMAGYGFGLWLNPGEPPFVRWGENTGLFVYSIVSLGLSMVLVQVPASIIEIARHDWGRGKVQK
jgi:hypothetical protein